MTRDERGKHSRKTEESFKETKKKKKTTTVKPEQNHRKAYRQTSLHIYEGSKTMKKQDKNMERK